MGAQSRETLRSGRAQSRETLRSGAGLCAAKN